MLKLALIGAGRWGQNIERTLRGMPGIKLVVADNAADTKKIVMDDIDGVLVATPGSTHVEVALPFIQAGLPVFIEKPLAVNLPQARQLMRVSKARNLVQVGHIHLYNPAYMAAKKVAKKIGSICLLYFEGMAPGPVRKDMSVWWDWGPHGVSMMLDLLGEQACGVQAWGINILSSQAKLSDVVEAHITFNSGVEAICLTSWLGPEKRTKLTIIGEKGSVVFDDRAEKKVICYGADGVVSYPGYSQEPALYAEMKEFVRTVKTQQPVLTGIDNGLAVVEVLDAGVRSMRQGGEMMGIKKLTRITKAP